jgi:hypothetical protein
LFIIDSSEIMIEPMGRQDNPLAGITAMIDTWAKQAPFVSNLAAADSTSAGLRVGAIKAGDNTYQCQSCDLTNTYATLSNDLKYIRTNVNASTFMIVDSAIDKSIDILTNVRSSNRQKVVVFIAGGKVGWLTAAMVQKLQGRGIRVIGAAVDTNQQTLTTLNKLVDDPASKYLQPVRADDFDTMFLNRMCHSFDFVTSVLSSQAAIYANIVLPCNGVPNRICQSYSHCF